ncbi:RNA methyltransferase, RsmE family [Saprospira grandis DSM 2844]|uniref:Ribosomal RNA small subunit methyltransferase E n=1 Tax=Saprospira grandis DSM 2844 TaxID=694433 RepID=J0PBM6_9BACT|nr:RsmE family RNA methyltransferase [Saprospira grandis]EJF55047.1 RNA methyltransferase, RsmE family [Saprospira grandis DSM 2844]
MQLFYCPNIQGQQAILEEDEFRHACKTLRKKEGDQLHLFDGRGHYYLAQIAKTSKREALLDILEQEERPLPWSFSLHLALAPTKNMDRMEWLVEKAVEVGVNKISLFLSQQSERKKVRLDRLQRIALSAAKQSHKWVLPEWGELEKFSDFLPQQKAQHRFIAHCHSTDLPLLKAACPKTIGPKEEILILLGPEGDFSWPEVELAEAAGFRSVSLGHSRLRTETAALYACQGIQWELAQ